MSKKRDEMLDNEIFKHKVSFMLSKFEETNRYIESVVNTLKEEGYKGIKEYQRDFLHDIRTLLINIEFVNALDPEMGRFSIDGFLEDANSLLFEIKDVIEKKDVNITYMLGSFDKYKESYKEVCEDFRLT